MGALTFASYAEALNHLAMLPDWTTLNSRILQLASGRWAVVLRAAS